MAAASVGAGPRQTLGPMATCPGQAAAPAERVMQAEEIAAVFGGEGRRHNISVTFHNCVFVPKQ